MSAGDMSRARELIAAEVLDPFEDAPEIAALRDWSTDKEKELNDYAQELDGYGEEIPYFMYKSGDKFVLMLLERYKEAGVDKPVATLARTLAEVEQRMKNPHPFVHILVQRANEDVELLRKYRDGEDVDGTTAELMKRGLF